MRKVHNDQVYALIGYALQLGAKRKSMFRVEWHIAGDCSDPYFTTMWGRPTLYPGQREKLIIPGVQNTPQELEIWTRCRKCIRCLRARSRRWYGAATRESQQATRTWFGTLTLSPHEHFMAFTRAREKLAAQGVDLDKLNAHEQFVARHVAIGHDLTKMIKRIRKNSGARLRYLLVCEAHKSGLPHYHMLIHERPLAGTVPHRILSNAWSLGFERWRLINPHDPKDNPAYLAKYLSKSLSARVRASQGYGGAYSAIHAYVTAELWRLQEQGREKRESRALPFLSSPIDPLFE